MTSISDENRIEYTHVVLMEPRIASFTMNGLVVVAQILILDSTLLTRLRLLYSTEKVIR